MFSHNSISIRLFNGYFIIIIFLGIIAIISLVKLGSINYLKKDIANNNFLITLISNQEIYKEKLIFKTTLLGINGKEREVSKACLGILDNMKKDLIKFAGISIDNPLLVRLGDSINNHCNILYDEYKTKPYINMSILLPRINNLGVVIGAFKHESYAETENLQASLESVIHSALLTVLFFFLITVFLSIFLSIKIGYSITNPLMKLMDVARKIRIGDLSVKLENYSNDEIGTLSISFNKMVETLNRDQQKIKKYNKNLELKNTELKNLSHRMITIQDDERKRLSQVIHEEIGQSLTALKINIKLLEHYYNNPSSVTGKNSEFNICVEDSREILRLTFKSIKSLTFSLRYNILDRMGILAATDYYIEQITKRSRRIRVITASNIDEKIFSDNVKMYLFRIICEALTNVIKHANATIIKVQFITEERNIVLHIFDNGSGFNIDNVLKNSADEVRMGLTTIKELVDIMNGDLQIDSELLRGTNLIIKVPYNKC